MELIKGEDCGQNEDVMDDFKSVLPHRKLVTFKCYILKFV